MISEDQTWRSNLVDIEHLQLYHYWYCVYKESKKSVLISQDHAALAEYDPWSEEGPEGIQGVQVNQQMWKS